MTLRHWLELGAMAVLGLVWVGAAAAAAPVNGGNGNDPLTVGARIFKTADADKNNLLDAGEMRKARAILAKALVNNLPSPPPGGDATITKIKHLAQGGTINAENVAQPQFQTWVSDRFSKAASTLASIQKSLASLAKAQAKSKARRMSQRRYTTRRRSTYPKKRSARGSRASSSNGQAKKPATDNKSRPQGIGGGSSQGGAKTRKPAVPPKTRQAKPASRPATAAPPQVAKPRPKPRPAPRARPAAVSRPAAAAGKKR